MHGYAILTDIRSRTDTTVELGAGTLYAAIKRLRTQGLLRRLAKNESEFEGRRCTPPLTHQQIADMIGTSRETVTRALKGRRQAGWLEQDGKRYLVRPEQS